MEAAKPGRSDFLPDVEVAKNKPAQGGTSQAQGVWFQQTSATDQAEHTGPALLGGGWLPCWSRWSALVSRAVHTGHASTRQPRGRSGHRAVPAWTRHGRGPRVRPGGVSPCYPSTPSLEQGKVTEASPGLVAVGLGWLWGLCPGDQNVHQGLEMAGLRNAPVQPAVSEGTDGTQRDQGLG